MFRLLALLTLLVTAPLAAQGVPIDPEPAETEAEATPPPAAQPAPRPATARVPVETRPAATIRRYGPRRLSGPRTGLTLLSPETVRTINESFERCTFTGSGETCDARISESIPIVTQFGWQFENRMFQTESGLTGVTEWLLLVGGAEQGLFLPSLTLLAGIRAPSGLEVGVGPNLSLAGAAYAVGVGVNNEIGEISIPVNAAVVFGQDGPRASLLVGFTVSERRW